MKPTLLTILFWISIYSFSQSTFHASLGRPETSSSQNSLDIVQVSNGDIYTTSIVNGAGITDIRLVRMNELGEVLLDTVYDFAHNFEFTPKVIEAHENGVIVASTSYSFPIDDQDGIQDMLVWKINPNGEVEWQQVLAARLFDSIIKTKDETYTIIGSSYEHSLDILVYRIDSKGEILWSSILREVNSNGANFRESPTVIYELDDGMLIGGNSTLSVVGGTDAIIYKLDHNGNTLWNMKHNRLVSDYTTIREFFKFNDTLYFVTNEELPVKGGYWLSQETGEYGSSNFEFHQNTRDFTTYLCGFEERIVSISEIGEDTFSLSLFSELDKFDYSQNIPDLKGVVFKLINSNDGGLLVVSTKSQDLFVTKMDCLGNIDFWDVSCGFQRPDDNDIWIYPNPANSLLTVEAEFDFNTLRVVNQLGQVLEYQNTCECNRKLLDISKLASGVYILQIEGEEDTTVTTFIKV